MSTGTSRTMAWPFYALAGGLLLIVSFVLREHISAASPDATGTSKGSHSGAPAAGCWLTVPSPDPANASSTLQGITAISMDDVWAVGYSSVNTNSQTLIEHWNGSNWSIVPSPNHGTSLNQLFGVDSLASNDMWAVGRADNHSLVLHWDGSAWSMVPSADQGTGGSVLTGVAALSANNVWAVGFYVSGTPNQTLAEHWDGTAWSIISTPTPYTGTLVGVTAVSANDVWAVGYTYYRQWQEPLIEHWNGADWSISSSPYILPGSLNSVTAISANDVWAVGYFGIPGQTLVMHWDGTAWSIIPSPNVGSSVNTLRSVAGTSANDVWAVGVYQDQYGPGRTLVEHWDGTAWDIVPSPNQGSDTNDLYGVAESEGNTWAVGLYAGASGLNQTLTQQYFPTCPTPTATPTPVPPPCPGERFTDVCPGDYFYTATLALADDGILSGYNTSPPCRNDLWIPCFNPYSSSTRGQISKVVSLAANFNDPVSGQTFEDVPPGSTFYTYTERMTERGIVSGYPCGSLSTPCVPPANLPYFRTNNNVTRGQLSKMISLAFGWNDPISGQTFQDVPPGSTFYNYIGQLLNRSIVSGYPCGSPSRPCVPPNNLPYFMPNNDVTRGQTAKIVQLARTQPMPVHTATITPTAAPSYTNGTPTDTPVAYYTAVPTDTSVPGSTATATPACCSGVTASINSYCKGAQYWFSYTITNSCPITVTANGAYTFEVAPTVNGPWEARIVGDCFNCPISPGVTQQSGATGWTGPLPPGANWWRTHLVYTGVGGCWRFDVASTPQSACVLGTATLTPVPTITATQARH